MRTVKKQSLVKVWTPGGMSYMGEGELVDDRAEAAVFESKGAAKSIAK